MSTTRRPVRVIIPAHNAVDTLASCLSALVASHNRHECEIIVVDDGGNGDLRAFRSADDVAVRTPPGRVGPAIARNIGAEGFSGELLVFIDADVEVAPSTISELIAPIRDDRAEATVGNYSADVSGLTFAQQYKQLYISHIYSRRCGYLRNHFWTAIGAVAGRTFFEIGGFHYRYFWVPEEDTEFGHRLTTHGKRILAVPSALGKHLKRYTILTLLRNDLQKGISSSSLAFRNRTRITDDRHATPRDIFSVATACGALGVSPLFLSFSPPLALAMTVCLYVLYATARHDLLLVYSDRGLRFLVKAFLTMLLLDYARGLALILGAGAATIQTASEVWEFRKDAATSCRPAAQRMAPAPKRPRRFPAWKASHGRHPGKDDNGEVAMKAATRSVGEWIRLLAKLIGPGIRMPSFVMMFVTNRCDAKCEHCFYWKELNTTKARNELMVDEVDLLTRSIGPIVQVTLTGGSPELRRDLPELAACFHRNCRPDNITICMNGYHTEWIVSHVRRILESCPGQRLTVSLSLDGLGEEHDQLRGMHGLFERVRATFAHLGRLRDYNPGLFVTCGTCMTGLNYRTVEATADWAWNNLPLDLLKVTLVRKTPPPPSCAAVAAECDRAYLRLICDEERWIRKEDNERFSLRSLAVRTKEVVLRQVIREIVETGHSPVCCGASRTNVTIYPDGTVAGCECRPDVLGNLRDVEMDLGRIWNGDAAREFRRKIVREGCSTHHHGYLSLPILRSPRMWPRLMRTAWKLWKKEHTAHA